MTLGRSAALLLGLFAQASCTVSAVSASDDPRPQKNDCTSDSDCGDGQCSQGLCQTLKGELEALLIAATPASDSSVPHLTFVLHVEDVPTSGGAKDLDLPGPSHVTGSLTLPKGETCYPTFVSDDPDRSIGPADDGKTLPVAVTFALSQRVLGLPQQLYFASTSVRNKKGGYTFDVQVPGGAYDVYLEPPKHQLGCPVPPQLYRNFPIDGPKEIAFPLSGISTLPLAIRWPKSSPSLTGWTVDIIEPLGGNPISTELVLGEPTDLGGKLATAQYPAMLAYSTVVSPVSAAEVVPASDLVRLRPPASVVAPTIFLDRSVLGVLPSDDDWIPYDRFTRIPSAVAIEGQMARLDTGEPVSGQVTLISTAIYGVDDGVFASYRTSVQVAADGAVHVKVPPGKYKVQALPPAPSGDPTVDRALGALATTWEIPLDPPVQYGKVLDLVASAEVTGQSRFQGAQVHAVPSPQTVTPFKDAFGSLDFSPRATTGSVDVAGQFLVQTDPGRFDISVQAPEALGFAWYVRPGVQVGEQNQDLGRVSLPKPSLLYGTVRVSLGGSQESLASAAISAYAYLDKDLAYTRDPKQAVSVAPVAETRADKNGDFRLLIPEHIAPASK